MSGAKKKSISPAGMKLLTRLANNPIMTTREADRSVSAIQNLLEMRCISGWAIESGWRWQIHEPGWKALGWPPQAATHDRESVAFQWQRRQAMEAKMGVPAQAELFGRAA